MKFPNFIGGYGESQSQNVETEATINLFVETVESGNGKNSHVLYRRPGYSEFADASSLPLRITSPCPTVQPVFGEAYSYTLTAIGGTEPYTWSLVSGPFPTTLSINASTGEISGTPDESGTFAWTVKVTDANGFTAQITCQFLIPDELEITSGCPVEQPVIGDPFSFTFTATGGTLPYIWSIIAGSLPPSFSLDPATGEISSTEVTAEDIGTWPYTLQVADAEDPPQTDQIECEFEIAEDCTPWTADTGGEVIDPALCEDDDYVYSAVDRFPGTMERFLKSDGSSGGTVVVGDSNQGIIFAACQDADYVYAYAWGDNFPSAKHQWLCRIHKDDWSTVDLLDLTGVTSVNSPAQNAAFIQGGYIYLLSTKDPDPPDSNNWQCIFRVLLSDFATIAKCTWQAGTTGDTSQAVAMGHDADLIFVNSKRESTSGDALPEFRFRRIDIPTFTLLDTTVMNVGVGNNNPNVAHGIPVDSSYAFVPFISLGSSGVVKIDKTTPATYTVTILALGGIGWSAYNSTYFYLVNFNSILRFLFSDISTFEVMTLSSASRFAILATEEGVLTLNNFTDNQVQHICEFVPDE